MNDVTAARAERDRRIYELRAMGWLQKDIAAEVGCDQTTVSRVLDPARIERERARYRSPEYREWHRGYRAANAERIREREKARIPYKVQQVRAWRLKNPERHKASKQAHYRANRELQLAQMRKYRKANLEQLRESRRARHAANREASRAASGRRRARRRNNGLPLDAVDRLLSTEYRKAIARDLCTYCGSLGEHDDHKLPLARGGTDHWWNLHRTCKDCNFRKHTKTHEEFLASRQAPLAAAS